MTMTIVEVARGVTGGVDTHLDVHVAAAVDPLGGLLGTERFETNAGRPYLPFLWVPRVGPRSGSEAGAVRGWLHRCTFGGN
jgi:hypothetical protein